MVAVTVDAGEHIGLIPHVIRQMGLRGDLAEEAFSLGLVSITKAAKEYNPSRTQGNLANWLARNLRWDIQTMLQKQKPIYPLETALESATMPESRVSDFNQVVRQAQEILTPTEHKVIMAVAYGYRNFEIARVLGLKAATISAIKRSAQIKLKEQR